MVPSFLTGNPLGAVLWEFLIELFRDFLDGHAFDSYVENLLSATLWEFSIELFRDFLDGQTFDSYAKDYLDAP
jgi:hypothetical protein